MRPLSESAPNPTERDRGESHLPGIKSAGGEGGAGSTTNNARVVQGIGVSPKPEVSLWSRVFSVSNGAAVSGGCVTAGGERRAARCAPVDRAADLSRTWQLRGDFKEHF